MKTTTIQVKTNTVQTIPEWINHNTIKYLQYRVKESRNSPGVAQGVPGGLGSQISWHSAREGGEVVSITHRPPLHPGMLLVLIFTRGWVDPSSMVQSGGNMSLKNPVTPPGINPGTVRIVAQCLSHYVTPGPYPQCKVTLMYMALLSPRTST